MSIIDNINAIAFRANLNLCGVVIVYRRRSGSIELTVTLTAILGKTNETAIDSATGNVMSLSFSDLELIFNTLELVLGGVLCEPQAGDRIDVTTTIGDETYEVLRIPGSNVFTYLDPMKSIIKVYAKK